MAVTNMSLANIPYWGCLPMMYTNYGGDTQISTIPSYAGYNLNLLFNPAAQATWGTTGLGNNPWMQTPQINQQAVMQQAQALLTPALNQLTSQNINLCINNIATTKSRLQSAMQAEGTTEKERDQIQKILDQLKEQENKINEIKNSENLDPQTAYQKVSEIESNVSKLVREAIKLINKTTGSTDTTSSTGSTSTTGSTGSTNTTETTASTKTTESTSTTETTETTQGKVDDFSEDVKAAVDQAYDAMYCWGTKDEALEEVLNLINKDNVMDLMLGWNKYHSGEKGETFMDAFMWDADAGQKEKYGKLIARALRDKAEELGIYDQCRADFAAIDKEMNSWLYISNDVSANYNNIIAKIAEKMGSKYGKPQGK